MITAALSRASNKLATLIVCIVVMLGFPTLTEAIGTIEFNDENGLKDVYPNERDNAAARCQFANNYIEDGMVFRDGVIPSDDRLGAPPPVHYHLVYEDNFFNGFEERTFPDGTRVILEILSDGTPLPTKILPNGMKVFPYFPCSDRQLNPNPEKQGRKLAPHSAGRVIQMTYEPTGGGIRRPFNLLSIKVLRGKLNIGVQFPDGSIGVYNNLTAGPTGTQWILLDGVNLTRATLEAAPETELQFTVDDIEFEPFTGVRSAAPAALQEEPIELIAQAITINEIPPDLLTPELEALVMSLAPLETTRPSCALTNTGTNAEGKKFIQITGRDIESGLATIEVLTAENAVVSIPPIPAGTFDPVVVTVTEINQSMPARVELGVIDSVGNVTRCAPVQTLGSPCGSIVDDGPGGAPDTIAGHLITHRCAGGVCRGTDGNDVILGTDDADQIYGFRGDDTICGLGGDDLIVGGDGDDNLDGGPGDDDLYGQRGDDNLYGGEGNDLLAGGYGNDNLDGGPGKDRLYGGPGADTLVGGGTDTPTTDGERDLLAAGGDAGDLCPSASPTEDRLVGC